MAKKSNKTSYVLNVIKNAGVQEEDPDSFKPTWMTPGEFQNEFPDRAAAQPQPQGDPLIHRDQQGAERALGTAVKQQMTDQPEVSEPVSDLKKMLGGKDELADPLSDKIRASLESVLSAEFPSSGQQEKYEEKPGINEGETDMSLDELNRYGTAFSFEKPDTVETDRNTELNNTSMAEDDMDVTSDGNDYIFVNVAEELVRSKVPAIMKGEKMCTCKRCINDVVALTLNHIAPRYVVTKKGKLYARINACLPQYQAELLEAIGNACETVRLNTRHTAPLDGEQLSDEEA